MLRKGAFWATSSEYGNNSINSKEKRQFFVVLNHQLNVPDLWHACFGWPRWKVRQMHGWVFRGACHVKKHKKNWVHIGITFLKYIMYRGFIAGFSTLFFNAIWIPGGKGWEPYSKLLHVHGEKKMSHSVDEINVLFPFISGNSPLCKRRFKIRCKALCELASVIHIINVTSPCI